MKNIVNNYKYKMSKACFESIINTRQGKEKSMNPYIYAVDYINKEYGLKGTCVEVVVY
jgi:hypothetical protein